MVRFELRHPRATVEMLGYIPMFLDVKDPRSAKEQLHESYEHGGGWRPFKGFKVLPNGNISYAGDPPLQLIAEVTIRKETVRIYQNAWVMIMQEDGSYEISKMD